MATLEILLTLPPGARVTIAYTFKKLLLRWNEYTADPNHGVYLPTSTVVFQLSPGELERQRSILNPIFLELALPAWASTYAEYLLVINLCYDNNNSICLELLHKLSSGYF